MKTRYHLLQTFGNTHGAVFATDAHRRIIFWNVGARRLFGYSEDEVLSQRCWRVLGGRRGQLPWCGPNCRIQRCISRGGLPPYYCFETQTKEGRAICVGVNIIRLEHEGKPIAVHLLTNVTRQERMRAALISIQSALKANGMAPATRETTEAATPEKASGRRQTDQASSLTPREVEILKLMMDGLSSQVIASRLVISHFTVRNHIQNLLCKLGLHTRAQAVSFGFTRGLL